MHIRTLRAPWTGLARIAARRDLWAIFDALGGAASARRATAEEWRAAGLRAEDWDVVQRTGAWDAEGVTAGTEGFPERLQGLAHGPVALTLEGNLALLDGPAVAIVGARQCTGTGRAWSRRIAAAVVEAGGVVVSGLADGIDTEAHLAARGRTIAVIGAGLRASMPGWQARLRAQILGAGGLLVSEFPPYLSPARWTFPVRNRVLAALSDATVVVEAGARSGARITARAAVGFGREVLAVPADPDALASAGCLDLIEEGATVVRDVDTVIAAARLRPRVPPASLTALGLTGRGEGLSEERSRAR
jgi:DNA processing protein